MITRDLEFGTRPPSCKSGRAHAWNDHMHLIDNHFRSQGAGYVHARDEILKNRLHPEVRSAEFEKENEGFCCCSRAIEGQKQVPSELYRRTSSPLIASRSQRKERSLGSPVISVTRSAPINALVFLVSLLVED